jgi:hypothetical protein
VNRSEIIEAATTRAAYSPEVFDPRKSAIIPKADPALLYSFAGSTPADFDSHVYAHLGKTQSFRDCQVIAEAIMERCRRQLVGGAE